MVRFFHRYLMGLAVRMWRGQSYSGVYQVGLWRFPMTG